MSWLICAYYTQGTLYENHAKKLENSLKQLSLPYEFTEVSNLGNWYANTQYKPTFLKQMLEKHYPTSVIYIDVDAIFCRYPSYFDKLESISEVNVAVHVLDHSRYKRANLTPEMLSGTIFLKNTPTTKQIVDEWVQECKRDPKVWDQRALATVLRKYKYHLLPEEYCTIFDYMSSVENPVIKHFQASRENRSGVGIRKDTRRVVVEKDTKRVPVKKKRIRPIPRRVEKNGIIHIRRTNQIS